MDLGFNQYTSGGKIGVRSIYVKNMKPVGTYIHFSTIAQYANENSIPLHQTLFCCCVPTENRKIYIFTTFNEPCSPTGRTLLWVMKNIYIVTEIFFKNFLGEKKNGR